MNNARWRDVAKNHRKPQKQREHWREVPTSCRLSVGFQPDTTQSKQPGSTRKIMNAGSEPRASAGDTCGFLTTLLYAFVSFVHFVRFCVSKVAKKFATYQKNHTFAQGKTGASCNPHSEGAGRQSGGFVELVVTKTK